MSFRRGFMVGPLRILCSDCFRENVLAIREFLAQKNAYRCPRCMDTLDRAYLLVPGAKRDRRA